MSKTTKNLLFFLLMLMLTLLLTSCEGDEGPVGPVGPEGPAGEDGVDGVDGADGADAEFSIVNVSFTGAAAGIEGSLTRYDVSVPEITQEIINTGAVLAYVNNSTSEAPDDLWILMPFTTSFIDWTMSYSCAVSPGAVAFLFTTTYDLGWPNAPGAYYHFKFILLSEPLKAGLDIDDFEEVRAYCQERLTDGGH